MRRAAEITELAHRRAMPATAPGVGEQDLEAIITWTFRAEGGDGPGYVPIVAGGANGVVLHYIRNRLPLVDGEMVLVDAGCEHGFYTADVTRTWPVNGRFDPNQRRFYEVVLRAQELAVDACRVGNSFDDVHAAAVRALTEGMVELGLLEGDVDELIEEKSFRKYYMHGTSHWLGLDVHDVGSYGRGQSRPLQPGMVLTVEPGLYVAVDDEEAPAELRGMAVRIEDDIHVTTGDPENLTGGIPKTVAEIEAACAERFER